MSDKYTPEERFIIETNRMRLDPQPHQRLLDPTPSPRRIENRVSALEERMGAVNGIEERIARIEAKLNLYTPKPITPPQPAADDAKAGGE